MDALLLNDDDKNLSNLVACIFSEPYEYISMKKFLIKRTEDIHRCRNKLVKKFGMYYFQQMTEEEWEQKKTAFVTMRTGIHTADDLNKLMLDETQVRDPFD